MVSWGSACDWLWCADRLAAAAPHRAARPARPPGTPAPAAAPSESQGRHAARVGADQPGPCGVALYQPNLLLSPALAWLVSVSLPLLLIWVAGMGLWLSRALQPARQADGSQRSANLETR